MSYWGGAGEMDARQRRKAAHRSGAEEPLLSELSEIASLARAHLIERSEIEFIAPPPETGSPKPGRTRN